MPFATTRVGVLRRCSIFTLQLLRCALPRFPWKGFPASLPATGVRRWPNAKSTGPGGQTKTGLPQQAGERPGVNVVRLAGFPCYRGVPQILVWCPALRPGGFGGAEEARTPDIRLAKAALSQLSYGPSGCTSVPRPLDSGYGAYSPGMDGGPFWTRTRDLSLIRTAL